MIQQQIYLLSYILYYIILYMWFSIRLRTFTPGCNTLFFPIFYAFSGFCAIVFFNIMYFMFGTYDNLTAEPLIYLAICNTIAFIPFFRLDCNNYTFCESIGQEKKIDLLSQIIAICAILPFLETLLELPSVMGKQESLADVYQMRLDGADVQSYLSFIGRKFFYINQILEYFVAPLLFIQINRNRPNKKLILGLIICLVTTWLNAMIMGGRSRMVQSILYAVVVYLLYRRFLADFVNAKIVRYGTIVLGIGIGAMMLVTISRFIVKDSGTYDNPFEWMSLYLGEGILNFNVDLWDLNNTSGGRICFPLFMSAFDNHWITIIDVWEYGDKLGIRGNHYYTWVGQLFTDFGRYSTIFVIVIMTFCFGSVLRNKTKALGPSDLIILGMWAKLLAVGPFFFALGESTNQLYIILTVFICLFWLKK